MTIIDELANRLFTVCAIHMEYPYVQYQGDSMFARVLASTLQELLVEFYSEQDERKIKEPRGHLLILDRTFDLISPVVHDFYYQTGVSDYKDGFGKDGEIKIDNKTVLLND